MEVLAILFVAWLLLRALRHRPAPVAPTITITIREVRDDGGQKPVGPIVPRDEPEVRAARERRALS